MSRGRFVVGTLIAGLLVLVALPGLVSAETRVEITRPLDGSTVRETVNILVPVSSVPRDGFVSCIIDGKFRSALASKTDDGQHFVYRWDTKADNPDPSLRPEQRAAADGKHTIAIQAYDSRGRKAGEPREITVYVTNSAASLMPSEGILLRYTTRRDQENKFRFENTINLKRIQGASSIGASLGTAIEGSAGVVRRSVEDVMPDNTALIRQKLDGILEVYTAGQPTPMVGLQARSVYQIEDTTGRNTYALRSTSSGVPVSIDLPNLPRHRVRIGDTWTDAQRIFRDALSGRSVAVSMTSTLEALEWHDGYPCAKIRSEFTGSLRIPFSNTFQDNVTIIKGETVTYFAWQVGKLISSATTAQAKVAMDPSSVSGLTQQLVPAGATAGRQPRAPRPSYDQPGVEGPPGMGIGLPGYPTQRPTHSPTPGMGGVGYGGLIGESTATDIDLEIRQVLEAID